MKDVLDVKTFVIVHRKIGELFGKIREEVLVAKTTHSVICIYEETFGI